MRTLAAVMLAAFVAGAHAQATPAGLWKTIDDETRQERSHVRITESGGVYTGRVEKILDPSKGAATCEACPGDLKDKPILGLTIIKGVRQSESDKTVFEGGEILDPNNGKSYRVRLTPQDGGKSLAVRGYIGTPLLGRSQTWIRVE